MARKKAKIAPRIKRGAKVVGPSFDGWEKLSGSEFSRLQYAAQRFYYENYKDKDMLPSVWEWMLENEYSKDDVKAARAASGMSAISTTTSCVVMIMKDGCPDYNPAYAEHWLQAKGTTGEVKPLSEHIHKRVKDAIENGRHKVEEVQEEEAKPKKYVPSIQERIHEQSVHHVEAIEEWIEGFSDDPDAFDPKSFDVSKHFTRLQVTQAHARKIINFYEFELAELVELQNMPSPAKIKKMSEHDADMLEQLKEGFAHLSKAQIKKKVVALQKVIDACNVIIEAAKATRKVRKPKLRSASKQIEKLKFKSTDDKYSLASINPAEIVGASELWVFNCKTRKLGKYVAEIVDPKGMGRDGSGLQVKGTTIQGFKESDSYQKTLRKPDEQLKQFKAAGKVALRTFMEDIKTTDTKLNGRINVDTVLLRVN